MRAFLKIALAAALIGVGFVNGIASPVATAALGQVDPFDSARYSIQTKDHTGALAIIDSGQFDINIQTSEGYTLLHYAAEAGDLFLVKAMLDRGADPTIKSYKPALAPYEMAYSTLVKAELRKAMASRAATASNAARLPPGQAPAAASDMCQLARDNPASSSRSPAMRPYLAARDAIWYNHPDELSGLIEDCLKIDSQDEFGWTLLHHAVDRDRVALANILIEHRASKTIRNKDGQTALQLATSAEMKALLGPGAGPVAASALKGSRKRICQQKYQADAALCADSTCRMRSTRKWQQCLTTGNYW